MNDLAPHDNKGEGIPEERARAILEEQERWEFGAYVDGIPGLTMEQRIRLYDRSLSLEEARALLDEFIRENG
ncbi:MAG: hypothetical protein TR69_WS6001000854 [candidate division WS6 bacterium OLB20]|uniref:Antitoxin VbhA domain-containing protein n=1 Tax=candidate division WS6 bacterium OLB20 TaxID=1617426 RepID=A0A136LYV7_9BACT|nr:MAG: hypothetical protein TR69_WS6001000854 [candidate division WS6 bacterium OLB20]